MPAPETLRSRIGREEISDWLVVDQATIDRFAEATHDHQFIHVDPDRASETAFGGTIAHGFLVLSLLPHLRETAQPGMLDNVKVEVNYGSNKLRFLSAVPTNSRIRGRFKILDIVEKQPDTFQITTEVTVELEGKEKPALVIEWMTQVYV